MPITLQANMDQELVNLDEQMKSELQSIKDKYASLKKGVKAKYKKHLEKTYANGYKLKSMNDITMNDLSRLCEKLSLCTGANPPQINFFL